MVEILCGTCVFRVGLRNGRRQIHTTVIIVTLDINGVTSYFSYWSPGTCTFLTTNNGVLYMTQNRTFETIL